MAGSERPSTPNRSYHLAMPSASPKWCCRLCVALRGQRQLTLAQHCCHRCQPADTVDNVVSDTGIRQIQRESYFLDSLQNRLDSALHSTGMHMLAKHWAERMCGSKCFLTLAVNSSTRKVLNSGLHT